MQINVVLTSRCYISYSTWNKDSKSVSENQRNNIIVYIKIIKMIRKSLLPDKIYISKRKCAEWQKDLEQLNVAKHDIQGKP